MPRRKTTVRINGQDYVLAGEEPEEYMHEVAIYVDKKMSDIHFKYSKLSTSMVAVLAAINIADELLKERRSKAVARPVKTPPIPEQPKPEVASEPNTIARFNRTK